MLKKRFSYQHVITSITPANFPKNRALRGKSLACCYPDNTGSKLND
jgi:hypothetical protein